MCGGGGAPKPPPPKPPPPPPPPVTPPPTVTPTGSNTYHWVYSSWRSCNASGFETRSSLCRDQNNGSAARSSCTSTPYVSRTCGSTTPPPATYSWVYNGWGACSASGSQSRSARCRRDGSSTYVSTSLCSGSPVITQSCPPPPVIDPVPPSVVSGSFNKACATWGWTATTARVWIYMDAGKSMIVSWPLSVLQSAGVPLHTGGAYMSPQKNKSYNSSYLARLWPLKVWDGTVKARLNNWGYGQNGQPSIDSSSSSCGFGTNRLAR